MKPTRKIPLPLSSYVRRYLMETVYWMDHRERGAKSQVGTQCKTPSSFVFFMTFVGKAAIKKH